mgnify:CR=1 FL=1
MHGNKGKKQTEKHKKRISIANRGKHNSPNTEFQKGKKHTEKTIEKIKIARAGYIITDEWRRKMSKAHKGKKSHFWKGGITPMNRALRNSIEFRLWREAVFARDNWTCQECGKRGVKLNAHHIKSFAYYSELRFAIDNGITLCKDCHKLTDNYKKQNKFL